MPPKLLKGITWAHSRGITPLLAAGQRFSELFPDITVQWVKRSLQAFADEPLEDLTKEYDLLIIDHPWVGCAAATGCVLPLDACLPGTYLADQAKHSVGNSYFSYQYQDHLWALPIDAATPVASYRKDLLDRHGVSIPDTWEAVLDLAQRGKVAVPAIPIDILMNFYMFCIAHGNTPFQNREEVIDERTGVAALLTMQELYGRVDPRFFRCNPIAVAELMSSTDDYWYCPFAYGYSNYSRAGYGKKMLLYGDLVRFGSGSPQSERPQLGRPDGARLRSTIGGTGLSVSAHSPYKTEALQFAEWVVSGRIQSTLYMEHGGQPGHGSAWTNANANRLCNNYFQSILPAMERGYTRPRYNGYLHFQDQAGDPIRDYLMGQGTAGAVLEQINNIYKRSLTLENITV
jgi:multiple sugar transport system substrate-binding protein